MINNFVMIECFNKKQDNNLYMINVQIILSKAFFKDTMQPFQVYCLFYQLMVKLDLEKLLLWEPAIHINLISKISESYPESFQIFLKKLNRKNQILILLSKLLILKYTMKKSLIFKTISIYFKKFFQINYIFKLIIYLNYIF